MLPESSIYEESAIPSLSASVAFWENPVPSGFAQKLPPIYGPPTIFLPEIFATFQVVSLVLIFALRIIYVIIVHKVIMAGRALK